jgi:hypothetical protein
MAIIAAAGQQLGTLPQTRAGGKLRRRNSWVAIIRLGRPSEGTDGIRLEEGNERHEAQCSDAERKETEHFLHIDSYVFSNSR